MIQNRQIIRDAGRKYNHMKTIQQVLIETDHKSIESAYFYEHPINLWEVKDFDDITIGEFKNSISARFQDFLNRLCEMNAEASPEKQGILFVYKSQTHDIILGEVVGLIHADELMVLESGGNRHPESLRNDQSQSFRNRQCSG
jgi:hypothetical protein